jgi:hypothetical protein
MAGADWRNMPGAMHDPVAEAAAAQAAVDAAAVAAGVRAGQMMTGAYGQPGGPTVQVFIGDQELQALVYRVIYGTGQEAVYQQ